MKSLLLLLSVLIINFASAQNDSIPFRKSPLTNYNNPNLNKAFFKSFLLDVRDVATFPKNCNWKHSLVIGGVLVGDGIFLLLDRNIDDFFFKHTGKSMEFLEVHGERVGSGLYTFPLVAAAGITGAIIKDDRLKRASLLTCKSLAISSLTVNALKHTVGRDRPSSNDSLATPYKFWGIKESGSHKSFPSGHTITAFSIASMFAIEYSDKPVVPIIAYTVAATAPLARMIGHRHWSSDVFISAAMGYGISHLIYKLNNWQIKYHKKKLPYTYFEY